LDQLFAVINININPDLARLGPFLLTWHGLFTALGVAVGVWLGVRFGRQRGIPEDEAYNVAVILVLGGIIGARALFVLEHLKEFADRPLDVVRIDAGGISIYGALIGGTIAPYLYCLWRRLPKARIADAAALGAIVGMAVGRVGDIINGEHWAAATNLPWAVRYTHPNTLGQGEPVHPAVAYEALGDLLIFLVLFFIWRRGQREGYTFLAWAFLYGAMRFGLSFLRLDTLVWMGLRTAQIIALVAMAGSLLGFYLLSRQRVLTRAERRRRARLEGG